MDVSELAAKAAPFFLSLFLSAEPPFMPSGKDRFIDTMTRELNARGVADASTHAADLWEETRSSGEPFAMASALLLAILGLFLLFKPTTLTSLGLLFASFLALSWVHRVTPGAGMRVGRWTVPLPKFVTVSAALLGLAIAIFASGAN